MRINVKKSNGDHTTLDITTLLARLNEIKGDIKTRNEIIREIIHNSIAANASKIDIEIGFVNNLKVNIMINCYGNQLNVFKDTDSIFKAILEADVSTKRSNTEIIGGKGRGAKILLSAEKLIIESITNNKINKIEIDKPNEQIEKLYKLNDNESNGENVLVVKVLNEKDNTSMDGSIIRYSIMGVATNDIKCFEHTSLVKYLKYFTILAGIKSNISIPEELEINVKGLEENNGKSKGSTYITRNKTESIKVENVFDKLKEYGIKNRCEFSFIKCSNKEIECWNGKLSNDLLLDNCLTNEEESLLKQFFGEDECYIFRSTNKIFKKKMKIHKKDNDSDFFGIYGACEGVIINERFTDLSTANAGPKSGGNLFSQYFGYISSSKITPTGDRNRMEASNNFFVYKKELKDNIIPLINKILVLAVQPEDEEKQKYKQPEQDEKKHNDEQSVENQEMESIGLVKEIELIGETEEIQPVGEAEQKKENNKDIEFIRLLEETDPRVIQGLWAELKYILDNPKMIDNWVAYQRKTNRKKPHDFEYQDKFTEIKSKLINADNSKYIINISSVEQLDDSREGELIVYYLNCNASSSLVGMDIIELIKEVSKKKSNDQQDKLFNGVGQSLGIKNFKKHYDSISSSGFKLKLDKFIEEEVKEYKVDKKFPCLRSKILEEACVVLNDGGYKLDLSRVDAKLRN